MWSVSRSVEIIFGEQWTVFSVLKRNNAWRSQSSRGFKSLRYRRSRLRDWERGSEVRTLLVR